MSETVISDSPILLLGSLSSIRSMTRFQKLAFLCDQKILDKKDQYEWKSYYFGPYSTELQNDVEQLCDKELLKVEQLPHPLTKNPVSTYSLTGDGKLKFDTFRNTKQQIIVEIRKLLFRYQFHRTNTSLLQYVYEHYPKYTTNSRIKDEVMK